MTQAVTSSADPAIVQPVAKDFEYTIRLAVAIPLAWAKVLKTVGAHHYDYACREMATCGVVNGLYNIATQNEDPEFRAESSSWPSTHPVAWRDCDGMAKIMEQAHYEFDLGLIGQIRAWLRCTMDRIEARYAEVTSNPAVATAIGEAVQRTQYVQRQLARPDAVDVVGAWAPVVREMIEHAESQLRGALVVIGDARG